MFNYPQTGERYQHSAGWTIYIFNVLFASEEIKRLNPEFSCEITFIYESSGKFSTMPWSWFSQSYRKIAGLYIHRYNGRSPLNTRSYTPSQWREHWAADNAERDNHDDYTQYL